MYIVNIVQINFNNLYVFVLARVNKTLASWYEVYLRFVFHC